MTEAEATDELRALGNIPAWRKDEPVKVSANPWRNRSDMIAEDPQTAKQFIATGNVEPHGTSNVECAAGGYGDTPAEALDSMIDTARYLCAMEG